MKESQASELKVSKTPIVFAYYATIDNNNNGTEDGKYRELTTDLALEKIEGFSVYVPLEQTIHKYGAKEYAISRK